VSEVGSDELPEFLPWSGIAGHGRVVARLRQAADEDRPHHAYLIHGPSGIGKATVARTFAQALLCEAPAGRPCGSCDACRKCAAGRHVDLTTEEPQGTSLIIGVEQVAAVQRRLGFRLAGSRHRVVIFDGAGRMNPTAQNKLLKTLEEPPENTVLLLLAVQPGQLLTTQLDLVTRALAGDREAGAELVASVDRDRPGCETVLDRMQELLRDALVEATGAQREREHPGRTPTLALSPELIAARMDDLRPVRDRLGRNVHPGGLLDQLLRSWPAP
jgi:hypothetical protein